MTTPNQAMNIINVPLTQGASDKIASEKIPEDPTTRAGSNQVTTDTTMFVDDANVVTRDLAHILHIDDTINKLSDQNMDEQSIISFLKKPIILTQRNFFTSDTFAFTDSLSMPYSIFTRPEAAVWTNKLAGIYGIRMDMVFRIVVNANRFQQGRYIMAFTPLCSPLTSTSSLKEVVWNNSHMATLVQRTTVPHVEFDLCDDTAAELTVPFMSTKNFWNVQQIFNAVQTDILGYLNVYPYSPMVSPAGSITAGYTIYVSFTNVRFFGAASAQSGLNSNRTKKGLSDREVSNTNNGPISSVANAVSKGFKEFGSIPLLSTYANSISWVADRVANVASIFGYSKPTQGDSLSKVVIYQGSNHNTMDGDSDAKALSLISKPGVVKMAGIAGTEFDEMDFAYIKAKPAWFLTTPWATAAIPGDIISTINVTPRQAVTAGGAQNYQPVAFLSALFTFWRGSIVFRIKFVRTEFHSGRVQIAFYPSDVSNAIKTGNAAYVHRMIVDIRETPEIDFTVPYISPKLWTTASTGTVLITVVDPLVAPATVSNSVTLLHEVFGGPDFEVAVVTNFNAIPTSFSPQSGLSPAKLVSQNIGSSQVVANPVASTSIAIGDSVTNFRAYLKRYTPLFFNFSGVTGTTLNSPGVKMYVDGMPALSTSPPTNYLLPDLVAIVGSAYGMWRGGVRIRNVVNKNLNGNATENPSMMQAYTSTTFGAGFLNPSPSPNAGTSTVGVPNHTTFQDLRNNAIVSVEIPQYTYSYARSVCDATYYQGGSGNIAQAAVGFNGSLTQIDLNFVAPTSTTTAAEAGKNVHNIYRSLADDGNFMCFISIPPMITATSDLQAVLG